MSQAELWFVAPELVELRQGEPLPALEAGEIAARALASGVSQGTELLLFRGDGPTPFDPSLDAPGAPTYPRRYGYSWVGEVTDSKSAHWSAGDRLFVLAPHGYVHQLPASRSRRLPSGLPPERATLAANLETAVNAVWDAGVGLGDDVLILGGGIVGLLCGYAARVGGARRVRLIEPGARRRSAALELGFDEAWADERALASADADVVIEATGNPAVLDAAIRHTRREGTILVASFYGERTAPLGLGSDFHRRRLTLRASQVSTLPQGRSAGWSFERRFALVVDLLGDSRLDCLLEPSVAFESAAELYRSIAANPAATLQNVFRYGR